MKIKSKLLTNQVTIYPHWMIVTNRCPKKIKVDIEWDKEMKIFRVEVDKK